MLNTGTETFDAKEMELLEQARIALEAEDAAALAAAAAADAAEAAAAGAPAPVVEAPAAAPVAAPAAPAAAPTPVAAPVAQAPAAPAAAPSGAREAMRMAADALRAIVRHWDEFGPEHGFDEVVDQARRTLEPGPPLRFPHDDMGTPI